MAKTISVLIEPSVSDYGDTIVRMVGLDDGLGRWEIWEPSARAWVVLTCFTPSMFIEGSPLTRADLAARGIVDDGLPLRAPTARSS